MTTKRNSSSKIVIALIVVVIIVALVMSFYAIYRAGYGDGARHALSEAAQEVTEATTEPATESNEYDNEYDDEARGKYTSFIYEPFSKNSGAWLEGTTDKEVASAFRSEPKEGEWIWFGDKTGWMFQIKIDQVVKSGITPSKPLSNSKFYYEPVNGHGIWYEQEAEANYSPGTPKFMGTPKAGDYVQFFEGLQVRISEVKTNLN